MLKKEWQDIFMPMLLRLMVGPVFAVSYSVFAGTINTTSALLLFIGYAVSVFWVALHMGLNTFQSEFRDHAFEYLFTFPFKRSRLLAVKFVVRFFIMGFLFILYILLQSFLKLLSVLPPSNMLNSPLFNVFDFSFMAISLFIIGFFLSLVDWGSTRPAIPLLILASHSTLTLFIERSICNLKSSVGGLVLSGILLMIATGFFFNYSFLRLLRGNLGNDWNRSRKKSLSLIAWQKNGRNWGLLRNEFRIVARSFFFTALFAPVLFFITKVISFGGEQQSPLDPVISIAVIAALLIVFFAFYSGSGLFYNEFRYKALEYILTLPLSLRRVLIDKLLARILVLVPAVLAYMIFVGHFSERLAQGTGFLYYFLRPVYFPFWVVIMLFNGYFLSLFEMKNMMALVSLANLYTIVFVPLAMARILKVFSAAPQAMPMLIYGSGLLLTTLIPAIAFFKLLDRFDLAAPNRYSKVCGIFFFTTFSLLSLAGLIVMLFI